MTSIADTRRSQGREQPEGREVEEGLTLAERKQKNNLYNLCTNLNSSHVFGLDR